MPLPDEMLLYWLVFLPCLIAAGLLIRRDKFVWVEAVFGAPKKKKSKSRSDALPPFMPSLVYKWPDFGEFDTPVERDRLDGEFVQHLNEDGGHKYLNFATVATLVLRLDSHTQTPRVEVQINGKRVGKLSPRNARYVEHMLKELRVETPYSICNAIVCGGGTKANGHARGYGVWLDLKPADENLDVVLSEPFLSVKGLGGRMRERGGMWKRHSR